MTDNDIIFDFKGILSKISFPLPKHLDHLFKDMEAPYMTSHIVTKEEAEEYLRIATYHGSEPLAREGEETFGPRGYKNPAERFEYLKEVEARKNFELLKWNFIQEYSKDNYQTASEDIAIIINFMSLTEQFSTKNAFVNYGGIPVDRSEVAEYLRLKHGYYKKYNCDMGVGTIPSQIYAACYYYLDFLKGIAIQDSRYDEKLTLEFDQIKIKNDLVLASPQQVKNETRGKQKEPDRQTLSETFEDILKYQKVMELLVSKEFCQAHTYLWKDRKVGYKMTLVRILKQLHVQGYYQGNKSLSHDEIKAIANNTFGVQLGIDTVKKSFPGPAEAFIPVSTTLNT